MTIWVDAQLSPDIAKFLRREFPIDALALREIGLRDAKDEQIFAEARDADAVVMTKDQDFPYLLQRYGPPPRVIWITCGNTSNDHLCGILLQALPAAILMLEKGESLVEIF